MRFRRALLLWLLTILLSVDGRAQVPPITGTSTDGKPVAVTFPTPGVTCAPASGDLFPVGTTIVSCGPSSLTVTVTYVPPPLTIQFSTLPAGTVGVEYNYGMVGASGVRPYKWAASGLPPGITLPAGGSYLNGRPTTAGVYQVAITLTDSSSPSPLRATKTLPLTIAAGQTVAPPPLTITAATLPTGAVGAAYTGSLSASGGTAPYAWTTGAGLPPGIAMSGAGAFTGTPITAGSFAFPVTVRDSAATAQVLSKTLTITITAAPPAASGLVQAGNLVYLGAFRLPNTGTGTDKGSFNYGGTVLTFNPAKGSLFVGGFLWDNVVGEVSIPTPGTLSYTRRWYAPWVKTASVGTLPTATLLQPLTDLTEGHLWEINPNDPNSKLLGGLLPFGANELLIAGYPYYDGGMTQVLSHFRATTTFATLGDLLGPVAVTAPKAGYIAGYMAPVPGALQAALGGVAVSGKCCIAIVSRTSFGPALFAFNPADVGAKTPVPSTPLVYYPDAHPLGLWDGTGPYYNGSTQITGVVVAPGGSRSVLFFGRHGTGRFCYGSGTTNQSLDGTLDAAGNKYCYDLEDQNKGTHAYPYQYQVWAYDANDLAAARAGSKLPWDVKPYAVWALTFPYPATSTLIAGATYDPAANRLYLTQAQADGTKPIVHVYTVQ